MKLVLLLKLFTVFTFIFLFIHKLPCRVVEIKITKKCSLKIIKIKFKKKVMSDTKRILFIILISFRNLLILFLTIGRRYRWHS